MDFLMRKQCEMSREEAASYDSENLRKKFDLHESDRP